MSGQITYPLPSFNGTPLMFWEYKFNFLPHFTGHVITWPTYAGIKAKC